MEPYLVSILLITLSLGSSKSHLPHILVEVDLKNDGFHRELETRIAAENSLHLFRNCTWAMEETIPSGAYVDPDQLKELERLKLIPYQLQVVGFVNSEASQQNAKSHRLLIFFNESCLHSDKLHVKFPFHLRYHRAQSGGGYAVVKINRPKLLLRCDKILNTERVSAPCCQQCDDCDWNVIIPNQVSEDILIKVPVGNLDHTGLVSLVTLLVIIGGCLYILKPLCGIINV